MTFRSRHLLSALFLHGLLFLLLASSVQCMPKVTPPPVIQGVLLDPSRDQQARQQRAREEQQRALEQERLKQEQEAEQIRVREAEQQRQEEQQKKERESLKQKQEFERKKKEKEKAKEKKESQEQRKLKEEQKRKREEKIERQKALEREEQELRNRQLQADADAAERDRTLRAAATAQNEWAAVVAAHVRKNWLRPPDSDQAFQCKVQIEQLPGGQIMSRKMVQSCGNRLLDDSVLKAVDKSNPLPLVTNPAAFQRSFAFIFTPQ